MNNDQYDFIWLKLCLPTQEFNSKHAEWVIVTKLTHSNPIRQFCCGRQLWTFLFSFSLSLYPRAAICVRCSWQMVSEAKIHLSLFRVFIVMHCMCSLQFTRKILLCIVIRFGFWHLAFVRKRNVLAVSNLVVPCWIQRFSSYVYPRNVFFKEKSCVIFSCILTIPLMFLFFLLSMYIFKPIQTWKNVLSMNKHFFFKIRCTFTHGCRNMLFAN